MFKFTNKTIETTSICIWAFIRKLELERELELIRKSKRQLESKIVLEPKLILELMRTLQREMEIMRKLKFIPQFIDNELIRKLKLKLQDNNLDMFSKLKDCQKKLQRIVKIDKVLDTLTLIINKNINMINSYCLLKVQRIYRINFTSLKHINSDNSDGNKSKHLIIILTVLNSSKRHKITFAFLQLLTKIHRLKKDYGEIRNDIPQYWPSSKYRKKRIFEPNHRINCLLQTQFCIRQTLYKFYSSYEFSVSRIC